MGLEVAPFVQDLVVSNPISGDDVSQGDDHLRLLKTTLKATFPTATKAIYAPVAEAKTTSYTVVTGDENKSFYVDCTAGAVTITLPVLTAGAAGFNIRLIKSDVTLNPIFVIVAGAATFFSGPTSTARARRGIPGAPFNAVWSGGAWFVERCVAAPIGTALPFAGQALPVGYEWPNGQTLTSPATNYPEYIAVVSAPGTTPDMRGRSPFGKTNMGGGDNALLPSIPGTTIWGLGGAETIVVAQANLPAVNFAVTVSSLAGSGSGTTGVQNQNHTHAETSFADNGNAAFFADGGFGSLCQAPGDATAPNTSTESLTHGHAFSVTNVTGTGSGTAASGGSGTALNKLPPAIVMNFILVVE